MVQPFLLSGLSMNTQNSRVLKIPFFLAKVSPTSPKETEKLWDTQCVIDKKQNKKLFSHKLTIECMTQRAELKTQTEEVPRSIA